MIDTMHLFVTNKCTNNCPLCCNKNYDIEKIPLPTEEELSSVNTVCLTGGDPFLLGKWLDEIVDWLRRRENIKNIYIFTSGYACLLYLRKFKRLPNINGITFSPKSQEDWKAIKQLYIGGWQEDIKCLSSNRLYAFIDKFDDCNYSIDNTLLEILDYANADLDCEVFFRTWVKDFNSPENEIFRRIKNYD